MKKGCGCLGLVVLMAAFGLLAWRTPTPPRHQAGQASPVAPQPPPAPVGADRDLSIVRSSWSKEGFGTVALWSVTIKNSGTATYRDIQYETEYAAPSGTVLGRRKNIIYDVVKPKQTRTFKVNDGFLPAQATQASIAIVKAVADPGR